MYIKLDINLQRMAKHRVALSFWERDDVKAKERDYFCRNKRLKCVIQWLDIQKYVISLTQSHKNRLPPLLYVEMLYCVRDVGRRRYGWFRYLQKSSMMNIRSQTHLYNVYFEDKIFWTHYGTIDEIKTVRNWLESYGTRLAKIYNMACLLCMEDVIQNTWNRISTKVRRQDYQPVDLFKKTGVQLLGYWGIHFGYCAETSVRQALRRYAIFDDDDYNINESLNVNFFNRCSRKGFKFAVPYFWELLREDEKNGVLIPSLSLALRNLIKYRREHEYYRKDLYIDTILFLLNQFTDEMRVFLYEEKYVANSPKSSIPSDQPKNRNRILKMCLLMWPWNELCVPILEDMWSFFKGEDFLNFLKDITEQLHSDYKSGMPIKDGLIQRLLRSVWYAAPTKFKQVVNEEIIEKLFDVWDFSSIRMILNDEVMAEKRETLIKVFEEKLCTKVLEDENKILECISAVLMLEKGTEDEKQNLKLDYELLIKGNLKQLNDFFKAKEEKKYVKERINHKLICHYFIKKNQLNLADEFLNWIFDFNVNDIHNLKNNYKSDEFTYKQIYYLWTTSDSVEKAKSLSTNFLNWFLKTDDDILSFKENKLKPAVEKLSKYEYGVHGFKELFLETENFERLKPFLNWCSYPNENIEAIVAVVVQENVDDRCKFYIENNKTESAEKFLNWAFDTDKKRQDFLHKFMISDSFHYSSPGVVNCKTLISKPYNSKNDAKETLEKFKAFIKIFVKPMENSNIKKFKNELKKWAEKSKKIPGDYDTDVDSYLDTGESSTELGDSETEHEDDSDCRLLCKRDNYGLFMSLLNALVDED